jgi:hypothetical protein
MVLFEGFDFLKGAKIYVRASFKRDPGISKYFYVLCLRDNNFTSISFILFFVFIHSANCFPTIPVSKCPYVRGRVFPIWYPKSNTFLGRPLRTSNFSHKPIVSYPLLISQASKYLFPLICLSLFLFLSRNSIYYHTFPFRIHVPLHRAVTSTAIFRILCHLFYPTDTKRRKKKIKSKYLLAMPRFKYVKQLLKNFPSRK